MGGGKEESKHTHTHTACTVLTTRMLSVQTSLNKSPLIQFAFMQRHSVTLSGGGSISPPVRSIIHVLL